MSAIEQPVSNFSFDANASGVSWGAAFAGATAAAGLSLILLVLGAGLGFSTVSPWPGKGLGAAAVGVSTIVWLIITQIVASGMGGYLAGRLRIKWAAVHTDEVYFRDTAHGLLAWAIAALAVAAMIGSVAGNVTAGTFSAATSIASSYAGGGHSAGTMSGDTHGSSVSPSDRKGNEGESGYLDYTIDSLLRPNVSNDPSATAPNTNTTDNGTANSMDNPGRQEIVRIFVNALHAKALPESDQNYLAQVVAKRTGLAPADASKRVAAIFSSIQARSENIEQAARQAADRARKTAATSALWMFVALLSGAFCASLAATLGGKQRDKIVR